MRDRETIDAELRRIATMRRSSRELGGRPSSREVDALLDERLGHHAQASPTQATESRGAGIITDTRRDRVETDDLTPGRPRSVLRRLGRLGRVAALPLSLMVVATVFVFVAMFASHNRHPAAEPTEDPPSSARPQPIALAPPTTPAPPLAIVDRAFIDVLKQEGVPVPDQEYVMSHGHAVCDFLTREPNFTDAVGFVQRSSVWDANQSSEFAAGAIVSYCPQYEHASAGQLQQPYRNALTDLQAIQGRLQGIEGDLQGIRDGLQPIIGRQ